MLIREPPHKLELHSHPARTFPDSAALHPGYLAFA